MEQNYEMNSSQLLEYGALVSACEQGSKDNDFKILQGLINDGLNINSVGMDSESALMTYSGKDNSKSIVESLLNLGANVNFRDKDGRTPLMNASKKGCLENASLLIEKGCDINCFDCEGNTALFYTCKIGDSSIVNLLLGHNVLVNPSRNQAHAKKLFLAAFEMGYVEVLNLVLSDVNVNTIVDDKYAENRLIQACESNDVRMAQFVVDNSKQKLKPKDLTSTFLKACELGYERIVEILLKLGVNIESSCGFENTALILASKCGHLSIMKLLIDHGAKVNYSSQRFGKTALMYACAGWQKEAVKLLLSHGADVNQKSHHGMTAIMHSWTYLGSEITDLLIESSNLQESDLAGKTVLMYLCEHGNYETVEKLIKRFGNLEERDREGRTALLHACMDEDENLLSRIREDVVNLERDYDTKLYFSERWKRKKSVVEVLLRYGVNVDARDARGMSALMHCITYNHPDALQKLINAGAKMGFRNVDNCDELSLAVLAYKDKNCLSILISSGQLTDNKGRIRPEKKIASLYIDDEEPLICLMELGVFEWELCNGFLDEDIDILPYVIDAAKQFSIGPGLIGLVMSPLVTAIRARNWDVMNSVLNSLYFYPEDYSTLFTQRNTYPQLENFIAGDILHTPMSLFNWSLITASKAISLAGTPNTRKHQVDKLAIPQSFKNILLFKS